MTKHQEIRTKIDDEVTNLTTLIDGFYHTRRFLELLEQDDCPMYVAYAHPDGKFKYVSTPFAEALGYTKPEIYDKQWTEFMKDEESTRVYTDYINAITDGKAFTNYSTEYIKKDGSVLPLVWYTGIHHPGDDRLTLCIAIEKKD